MKQKYLVIDAFGNEVIIECDGLSYTGTRITCYDKPSHGGVTITCVFMGYSSWRVVK